MSALVQLDRDAIEKALEFNPEFFVQFFLGEEIDLPVPEFHKDIFSVMVSSAISRFVCAIPRDHAKTTLAKLACVHYFMFSKYRFIVYLSNTSDVAIPATNDIVNFLKSDNFVATFGHCTWIVEQHGKGLYKFVLPESLGKKTCILRALGAGKQVRGINVDNKRPQLAIVDDLEDNANIATLELFMKLKKWVYGPFLKCLDKFDNKVIWLGNMISKDSMLFENCNSHFWHSRRYGCLLANGNPLWEDAWSVDKLMQDYLVYQEAGLADVWFAEMMNLPMMNGGGIIEAEEITYKPALLPGDPAMGFLTIDLAISDKDWAHKTVIAVHIWVEEGYWQIAETIGWHGIDPIALFAEMVKIGQRWGIYMVGIESVAFQASLQTIYPHLCLVHQIEGFKFVPVPARAQKQVRIVSWAGMVKSGDYVLTEGDFNVTQELLEYNPKSRTNTDDTIDSCAQGNYMIANHYSEIFDMRNPQAHEAQQSQSIYSIARV